MKKHLSSHGSKSSHLEDVIFSFLCTLSDYIDTTISLKYVIYYVQKCVNCVDVFAGITNTDNTKI